MKKRNLVAKHARKFNKSIVMADKKKRLAAGYKKYKRQKGEQHEV
jgi:hypothetical protein